MTPEERERIDEHALRLVPSILPLLGAYCLTGVYAILP